MAGGLTAMPGRNSWEPRADSRSRAPAGPQAPSPSQDAACTRARVPALGTAAGDYIWTLTAWGRHPWEATLEAGGRALPARAPSVPERCSLSALPVEPCASLLPQDVTGTPEVPHARAPVHWAHPHPHVPPGHHRPPVPLLPVLPRRDSGQHRLWGEGQALERSTPRSSDWRWDAERRALVRSPVKRVQWSPWPVQAVPARPASPPQASDRHPPTPRAAEAAGRWDGHLWAEPGPGSEQAPGRDSDGPASPVRCVQPTRPEGQGHKEMTPPAPFEGWPQREAELTQDVTRRGSCTGA